MMRTATMPATDRAQEALSRVEPRPRPSKGERLLADTGLDTAALATILRRPADGDAPGRVDRLSTRSLALDGLR